MARLLVTGAAGFVGLAVVAQARARGHHVTGIDLHAEENAAVDLLDPTQIRRAIARVEPDAVIHLAGILRAPEVRMLYETNVVATSNLLEATLAERPTAKVVIASSSAVYGDPGSAAPISEDTMLRPLTAYAASKAAQEAVALRYGYAGLLSVVVGRAFNIVGPGQPSSLAAGAFASQVAALELRGGGELRVGSLSAIRDFVDVRDVAEAFVSLAESASTNAVFNICSGMGVQMQACVDFLVREARSPVTVVSEASRTQAQDVAAQIGDPKRLRDAFGWRVRLTLEESLRDLLDDWRQKRDRGAIHGT